jgi:hypothetical protein
LPPVLPPQACLFSSVILNKRRKNLANFGYRLPYGELREGFRLDTDFTQPPPNSLLLPKMQNIGIPLPPSQLPKVVQLSSAGTGHNDDSPGNKYLAPTAQFDVLEDFGKESEQDEPFEHPDYVWAG